VTYAAATLKMVEEWQEHRSWYAFDEGWLYRVCKQQDGLPHVEGTYLRIALKVVQKEGYLAHGTLVRGRHRAGADRRFAIRTYVALRSLREIKEAVRLVGPAALATEGDNGFVSPRGGNIRPPNGKSVGGHAYVVTGWDDGRHAFRIKNSWGVEWGDRGFAWLPYAYLEAYPDWNAWKAVDVVGEPG
jgi:hypothetical protein